MTTGKRRLIQGWTAPDGTQYRIGDIVTAEMVGERWDEVKDTGPLRRTGENEHKPAPAPEPEPEPVDLASLTVAELKELAKAADIDRYYSLNKGQLIEALEG